MSQQEEPEPVPEFTILARDTADVTLFDLDPVDSESYGNQGANIPPMRELVFVVPDRFLPAIGSGEIARLSFVFLPDKPE